MYFLTPVKNCFITNPFNAPASYPFALNRLQLHEGIDLAPAIKDADEEFIVFSAQKGVVHQVAYDKKGYGNFVVVKHDDRYYTWYGHLERVFVKVEDRVSWGDNIGVMGATGNAKGKHLHFNIQDMVQGLKDYVVPRVVDPVPLLVHKIDSCIISPVVYNVINRIINH